MITASGRTPSCSNANSLPVRPKPGLDFVRDEQHAVLRGRSRRPRFRNPAGGMMMPASPWIGSTRNAQVLGVIASLQRVRIAEGNDLEPRRERPEAVAVLFIAREADDGRRAAVEVVGADDDLGLAVGNALDLVSPLARGLDRGLHRFGARVHGQRHVEAGQVVQLLVEQRRADRCERPAR